MESTTAQKLSEILKSLSIDEEIRDSIYDYFINLKEIEKYDNEDFVIRIPHILQNKSFVLNKVIHVNTLKSSSVLNRSSAWEIVDTRKHDFKELLMSDISRITKKGRGKKRKAAINLWI